MLAECGSVGKSRDVVSMSRCTARKSMKKSRMSLELSVGPEQEPYEVLSQSEGESHSVIEPEMDI